MPTFKIVLSDPKTGLSTQREVKDQQASPLVGLKLGDKVNGDSIGLAGYEFEICGGSDYCGFPMRKDVVGVGRKKVLAVEGVGIRKIGKGIKQRKTVCGNTIHARTAQINMKVLKEGKEKIFVKKEKGKEEKKEKKEKVKEEKPEEKKPEKSKEEKKEKKKESKEKPKEEKKEIPKPKETKKEEKK